MSIDVSFFETIPFSLPSTVMSMGEDDDLLVYYVSLSVPTPTLIPVKPPITLIPVKPLITQVYSRGLNPTVSSLTQADSTLDPISSDDLPIALCKGECQCVHPIFSFCSYNLLSSHFCSFIALLDSIALPTTVRETLSHPGWYSAMMEEM